MVPIDSILTSREIRSNDDTTMLFESIESLGIKQPILVDKDMNLIDGMRRLDVALALGMEVVPAYISSTLEDSCTAIARARKHGIAAVPVDARRGWEVFTAVHAQMLERSARLRHRRKGIKRTDPTPDIVPRSRAMLGEALGHSGEAFIAASTLLYKAFTTNTDPARKEGLEEIQRKLEAGEMTLYEARGAMDRLGKMDMNGDILSVNDQRDALTSALSQLIGTTKGLTRIGELNPGLNQAEIQLYIKGFEQARRDLQRFITSIKKRVRA
jgi:hypothetical protein